MLLLYKKDRKDRFYLSLLSFLLYLWNSILNKILTFLSDISDTRDISVQFLSLHFLGVGVAFEIAVAVCVGVTSAVGVASGVGVGSGAISSSV